MDNSEKYSKKRIFLTYVGILAVGLPVFGLLVHLAHPEQTGLVFDQILPILSLVVGAGSSLMVENRPNSVKATVFLVELGIIVVIWRLINLSDIMQVAALFSGAFWGAGRVFNKDFFGKK